MKQVYVGSASDEIQYRLTRLEKIVPDLKESRLVVYGTGVNAKRVLDCMSSVNVLGLMDADYTGKYVYGKKVLTEEEILLLQADTILMAAEPSSAQVIYKRILEFCMDHHIKILDMYGCDELQLHQNIIEQELHYTQLKEEHIKKSILSKDALVISFQDVLYSQIITEEKKFYEKVEEKLKAEGITIPNFTRSRMAASKKVSPGNDIGLKEVYNVLPIIIAAEGKKFERARAIEMQLTEENFVPRIPMINLLQYAIDAGKDVYICFDLIDGNRIVPDLLQKYNIDQYKKVFAGGKDLTGLIGRTIRALGEAYGYDRVLYIGSEISDDLIIPQLYRVDFYLIQGGYDSFFRFSSLQISRELIENNQNRDEIVTEILKAYNTPFLSEIDRTSFDGVIAEKIGWREDEERAEAEILPVKYWSSIDEVASMRFAEVENPKVSIIIPAYNQFAYTYNCLQSILLNTDYVSYEVIVADDYSYDLTVSLEKIISGITVIHNKKNLGFLRNCNHAAKKARGRYLLFLNNDTQVQLNWLYPLVKCMEINEDAGIAGAKLIYPDGRLQEAGSIIWSNANGWNYGNGKNPNSPDYSYVREADYISGAAIIISKQLWDEIGGFDERYAPAYFEDVDLAFEVRKREKKVLYQPDSVVVHFEGVSNGKSVEKGIKAYQKVNKDKFAVKWKEELLKGQYPEGENILAACERKQQKKTVLFISESIPTYDRDAGSRTLDFYIQEFIWRGYIVKFIPNNFIGVEPYTHRLEQMGVEVLKGRYYQKTVKDWIYRNYRDIDFAFLNYPNAAMQYIDLFKKVGIPVIYYGVDLHYVRLRREYELFKNECKAREMKEFYDKEAYLIKNSDVVYYPSLVETEIIKNEFGREDVKQLMINIYDTEQAGYDYKPGERNGIMFIGGYKHTPNVDAVLWFSYHIFPQIYKKLQVPFYVVGANMTAEIRDMKVEGIEKIGALTDAELEEMYQRVKMIVVPLRYGAGIKGKVIEAMYHGVPVVTTSIGIEGIPNEEGAVKVVNTEDDFIKAVVSLYQMNEKLIEMSGKEQRIVRQYYSREAAWNNIVEDFK